MPYGCKRAIEIGEALNALRSCRPDLSEAKILKEVEKLSASAMGTEAGVIHGWAKIAQMGGILPFEWAPRRRFTYWLRNHFKLPIYWRLPFTQTWFCAWSAPTEPATWRAWVRALRITIRWGENHSEIVAVLKRGDMKPRAKIEIAKMPCLACGGGGAEIIRTADGEDIGTQPCTYCQGSGEIKCRTIK